MFRKKLIPETEICIAVVVKGFERTPENILEIVALKLSSFTPDKEVAIWLIFIKLPKLTSLLLIVSHNIKVKRKIGIRSIA